MPSTITEEETYHLGFHAEQELAIRLHLIADTSIGVTVWKSGRLTTIINAPLGLPYTLFVCQAVPGRVALPNMALAGHMRGTGALLLLQALGDKHHGVFIRSLKLGYGGDLAAGFPRLPNAGELAKTYVRRDAALYVYPAGRKAFPKLSGAMFRVL